MELSPKSLRQKLALYYITVVLLITGFVLFSWGNLNNLEDMVVAGDVLTDLFDTTLEIRRFEKNYFLYGDSEDHDELRRYVDSAEELLLQKELTMFTPPGVVAELKDSVRQYRGMLAAGPGENRADWENSIRAKGKDVVTVTGRISGDRKEIKRETLRAAKMHLAIGMSIVLAAVLAGGFMFYRKAVRPLSIIEEHMDRISDDKFSLGTLVLGVAHELKNPISNISTSCQILKEEMAEGDAEHKRELLRQIEAEADRARDVVVSLLEHSRYKEKKRFNLQRAVSETIRLLRAELPSKITIATNVPAGIELLADKQKIQQLLLNLIKNAADATGEEGEIKVFASAGPDQVRIGVRDSGEGMDKETLSKIFDPFFSSKKGGYGLGLFIVHNIVQEHDGTISVDSSPGHGTMFTITLPVKES